MPQAEQGYFHSGSPGDSTLSLANDRDALRRQVHLKSEHKRRDQIKDGFDQLRECLPETLNPSKMSKSEILRESLDYLNALERECAPIAMGTLGISPSEIIPTASLVYHEMELQ